MDEATRRDPRGQGDRGELIAATWLVEQGAQVFIPLLPTSRDYDLIADSGARLDRVQVKTTSLFRKRRWEATLCTRGGNRSWSGLVKLLDPARYDMLFVVVGDGRRWLVPSRESPAAPGSDSGDPGTRPLRSSQAHLSSERGVARLRAPGRGSGAVKRTGL